MVFLIAPFLMASLPDCAGTVHRSIMRMAGSWTWTG
jgi:hypothetical protein